jgi:hypothetical protein
VIPIRVTTTLTPRDVARATATLVFRNRISLPLLAIGPLWFVLGSLTGYELVARQGAALLWLVPLVPAFALLAATYNAYRPGSRVIYEPAEWTFADDGVRITQPGRDALAVWTDFDRWRSAAGCLLLHTTRSRYVIIPWRDVPQPQLEELEALLGERIGRRRR